MRTCGTGGKRRWVSQNSPGENQVWMLDWEAPVPSGPCGPGADWQTNETKKMGSLKDCCLLSYLPKLATELFHLTPEHVENKNFFFCRKH